MSRGTQLLELLDQVEQADLDQLDGEIEKAQSRLSQLSQTRKLIAAKLGVDEPKKPRTSKAGKGSVGATSATNNTELIAKRKRIARMLASTGPLLDTVIANRCELAPQGIHWALKCDWFESTPTGWRLTELGRREALPA